MTLDDEIGFTLLIALAAFNTWLKLLLRMRVTRTFGPMFKMLLNMAYDLVIFMFLWVVILLTFTCVSNLIFGDLPSFQNFFSSLQIFFEAALGSWDANVYRGNDIYGEPLTELRIIGLVFNMIFLLINMVLLLNFVIAILSATFTKFEDKQLGLYYEVIVAMFPAMEYEERYGAVVCSQAPFNLLILPFQIITFIPMSEESLKLFNLFLCHVLYLPIGVVVTICFAIMDLAIMPWAYIGHTFTLIKTITDSDETMDELSEKVRRVFTIIKFIMLGPIILPLSIILDMMKFWWNLYTKPHDSD